MSTAASPSMITDLKILFAILRDAGGSIRLPRNGWTIPRLAELLAVQPVSLANAIRRECGVGTQPDTARIDLLLRELSARELTPPGGWSVASIAALASCSNKAIEHRLAHALRCARAAAIAALATSEN